MPVIKIRTDGTIHVIYSDDLLPLLKQGKADIRRASSVEPTSDGRWQADMSPVGGPVLPSRETRAEALAAEISWLNDNIL